MGENILGDFEDASEFVEAEQTPKEKMRVEVPDFLEKFEKKSYGLNIGFVSFEMRGKSILETLIGYLNKKYMNTDVKEAFPKVTELLSRGIVPEVEKIDVMDMDCSFEKLSHIGKFGLLAKKLYDDDVIRVAKFKIPKRQVKFTDGYAKEASKLAIQQAKLKIENTIAAKVKDNGPEIALIEDSLSSYDELLNDLFRIVYEEVINKSEDKDTLGSSLKGVRQSYYQIRNGWWVETLRDLRTYKGWNIDTFKKEPKPYKYLKMEMESAAKDDKQAKDISKFIIQWAPKTPYDLDLIFHIDNDGTNYWAELTNRFEGGKPISMREKYSYTPDNRWAFIEILEKIAPFLLGEVAVDGSELKEEDTWALPVKAKQVA